MLAQDIGSQEITGLTEQQAAERLRQDGYNELPSTRQRGIVAVALEVVREPMFVLLLSGGTVYLILGEITEGLALLASVFAIIGITLYQERKTEHALEALRDLSSPRVLVIRDGQQRRIAGREVVRGDLVVLAEGDRIPADGIIRNAVSLTVDESLLTGESVPVRKIAQSVGMGGTDSQTMGRPGGDDQPYVYSGTLAVQGRGIAEVLATGPRSEIGKIGRALEEVRIERTPLERETGRIVRIFAFWGLILCTVLVIVYGLLRGQWLEGILAGIALAMSVLPEEFPVVLTVFLALGAWRIAQARVLTRRMPAVETLGAATVLCVDKTGTLTQNRMTVSNLFVDGVLYDVPTGTGESIDERVHDVAVYGFLASQSDPFDPMEQALHAFASQATPEMIGRERALVREYPLTPELLAVTRVWADASDNPASDGMYVVATKGAPEAIADLCRLGETERQQLMEGVDALVSRGLRVLGVAGAQHVRGSLPDEVDSFDFKLLGLIGLADPIRLEVPAAVRECYGAGVRVVMITGDFPGTAQAIARQIGLRDPDSVITGPELDAMDDAALRERIATTNIFARVVPAQKLRLVNALKAHGEVVAMTGDGVNDAPALKAAHIGVAMGGRGTDVAREAAALVLLDDDFSSIVRAVRMGRRIYDNLRKAMSYVLAIHVPIAGLALLPVLFGWPLVLMPIQIVFLELIIDPVSSIVFEAEPEEADVMRRPPRNPRTPLFTRATVSLNILQGASILAIVLTVLLVSLRLGSPAPEVRALTFTTLIVANIALILTNRSRTRTILATLRTPNRALWWVIVGAAAVLIAVLYIPLLRDLFGFTLLHPDDLVICLTAGVASMALFEAMKVVRKRWPSLRS